MTDADRIRLAVPSNSRMFGPVERERCQKHPRRWVMFRWIWKDDISGGDIEIVRGCGTCLDEYKDDER